MALSQDILAELAEIAPGSPLEQARLTREAATRHAQGSYETLFSQQSADFALDEQCIGRWDMPCAAISDDGPALDTQLFDKAAVRKVNQAGAVQVVHYDLDHRIERPPVAHNGGLGHEAHLD